MPIIERRFYTDCQAILGAEVFDEFGVHVVAIISPSLATNGHWIVVGQSPEDHSKKIDEKLEDLFKDS